MAEKAYDRPADDVGNIVEIGHVNVNVPEQRAATDFYITALGLTRDPYMFTGTNNMWVNVGRHQFHLPTADRAQLFLGTVGLVVPRPERLRGRLADAGIPFADAAGAIEVRSPWGNRFRVHGPAPHFGPATLALAYVEREVEPGTAPAIARFYQAFLDAPAALGPDGRSATVHAGWQRLVFRERDGASEPYDGHHIQIYVANFSAPYRKLRERGLITQDAEHQYRFVDLVDPADGRVVHRLDHEVRSLRHPMFGRMLVNRDADVDARHYAAGREALVWESAAV